MLVYADDVARAAVVWLFTGSSNTDDDYERYIESIRRLVGYIGDRAAPAGILVSDPGNPAPNARWRREIAEATNDIDPQVMFALVSGSPLVRGVVTAINWIRPPTYRVQTFATFDGATEWIEQLDGPSPHIFEVLLAECRSRAAAGKPGG